MALYISKVQLPNEAEYLIKDKAAWEALTNLLGDPVEDAQGVYHFPAPEDSEGRTFGDIIQELITNEYITQINEAAKYEVTDGTADIVDGGVKLTRAGDIKAYVDSKVTELDTFDVVIDEPTSAQDNRPVTPASGDTFHKIYLVDASTPAQPNLYKEYITIREGVAPNYTYTWELIGDTSMSLETYLDTEATVAGVAFGVDKAISAQEIIDAIVANNALKNALGLKALAFADTASGTVAAQEFRDVDVVGDLDITVSGGSVSYTTTNASITSHSSFTPAGDVTVSLTTATAGFSAQGTYTPEGTIAPKAEGGVASVITSAAFEKDNAAGVEFEGTNAPSAVTFADTQTAQAVTGITGQALPSFTEGAFTPAEIEAGFYTAGSAATFSEGAFTPASLTQTNYNAAQDAVVASYVNTQDDPETLVFSTPTINTVTYVSAFSGGSKLADSFTPNTPAAVDVTKFSGGSKAADSWNAGSLGTLDKTAVISNLGTATAAAQVFTGDKYKITTQATNVLKDVEFSGSAKDVAVSGQYEKVSGATASFVATSTASIPATIQYDKASVGSISATADITGLSVATFTVTAKTVTVSPTV